LEHVKSITSVQESPEGLVVKLTGRYYTDERIANTLINSFITHFFESNSSKVSLKICDPFAGDGRLVYWLIKEWGQKGLFSVKWEVYLWDINEEGLRESKLKMESLKREGFNLEYFILNDDTFRLAVNRADLFDIVVTNPPWELIKPDTRELRHLNSDEKVNYIQSLKLYDEFLSVNYPNSQPEKKFAGWGTNLSRVGLELSSSIVKPDGWVLIILPASLFADEQSLKLRRQLFTNSTVFNISYFPAEAKLFGTADTSSATIVFKKSKRQDNAFKLSIFNKFLETEVEDTIRTDIKTLSLNGFSIPISVGPKALSIIDKFRSKNDSWGTIEKLGVDGLWAGREIDETGIENRLSEKGEGPKFIKGKMINRYEIKIRPTQFIKKIDKAVPSSVHFQRIVWRDVSRPSQKRRLIATIIPEGIVAGNSLGVCYYKDNNIHDLKILLSIMNSLCFEFQLRSHLATGHVSLSAIRRVYIPKRNAFSNFTDLLELSNDMLNGNLIVEPKLEALVAKKVYHLTADELELILNTFEKLTGDEKNNIMIEFKNIDYKNVIESNLENNNIKIHNHLTSRLSELDMFIVNSVPPGGNWKNIPDKVPSQRIKQIRESYAEGKGSRSTYYGRLLADKPSYTINTYFNRPGNGCHIHYSQNRVLSQREAARLQSFPDNFVFFGSQNSINTQIGNAVPPLLAYQIALRITELVGEPGQFIDLFSGAGGMGLGFKWAGWNPVIANDIESSFLDTYSKNVHTETIAGSIHDPIVFKALIACTKEAREKNPKLPLWVLGGPPCQGFSTAGNKRTMDDERNHLFINYTQFLKSAKPDGFVFENVAGLLNMEKGEVFEKVKNKFKNVMPNIKGFVLNSENYAIPQRRKRVFLIGQNAFTKEIEYPRILTSLREKRNLFDAYSNCVSVEDALSDLPRLMPGQNGSYLNYDSEPQTIYQCLMRGKITPLEYLQSFTNYI
jgi:DNA (cytosine-5)-methyltransferase 1